MKIVTVVGARPQFIKAAPVSRVLRQNHTEVLVHTGQHYDDNMSAVFFNEMGIPAPDYNLGIGSGPHGAQTGAMLTAIEKILLDEKPEWVLVYGDTNSTLAGALAAVKLHIPVAHVESGLRSYNRTMPEEHNRVLTDHCADLLFCPTQIAVDNLQKEGIRQGVHQVGDTMYDAVLQFAEIARRRSTILKALNIQPKQYLLATLHRPYNVDTPENLENLLKVFLQIQETIIFPVHPRTRQKIELLGGEVRAQLKNSAIRMIEPVGYLDMLWLEQNARMILTDSGGVQKEAYFFAVPCITLRPETEWIETVQAGWNVLAGEAVARVPEIVQGFTLPAERPNFFGDGQAAGKIAGLISAG